MLRPAAGGYRFLEGGGPYSAGVVADGGHEIVRVTLARSLPWRSGLGSVGRFLADAGHARSALCGIELRSPRQVTLDGFAEFNEEYRAVLGEWGLLVGGRNPVARTNVVPFIGPPAQTELFAFAFSRPAPRTEPTFLTAGAGELVDDALDADAIVRPGDVSAGGMAEKARHVVETIAFRVRGLGADWGNVTTTTVYTVHPLDDLVRNVLVPKVSVAAQRGFHWFVAQPPVQHLEFEMDARGVATELIHAL